MCYHAMQQIVIGYYLMVPKVIERLAVNTQKTALILYGKKLNPKKSNEVEGKEQF
jgi:hypothetical protein